MISLVVLINFVSVSTEYARYFLRMILFLKKFLGVLFPELPSVAWPLTVL